MSEDLQAQIRKLKNHINGLLVIIELMERGTLPTDFATRNNLKMWVDKAREASI